MTYFNEMGLSKALLKGLNELGFENPTPIQEKVIPHLAGNSNDLIALAQTGTGKTAAFGLPLVQHADLSRKNVQALVLCPTRELCVQITNDLQSFSKYQKGFSVVSVYGGTPIDRQVQQLRKGCQIVVGTPGRTKDLIERKALKIDSIQWLVLDEADEMLQMGFKDELDAILETTPPGKQTLLFSATMPSGVRRIASDYMNNPEEILIGTKNAGAENVVHEYYMSHAKNRYEVLKRIADMNPDIYGIVFCRTRRETKEVADKFMNDGYNADALHGDLSQAQRDYVMNRFRKRQLQMLVATDVAARGLDVNDLTHVINYNLPDDLDIYIHRSGRTGRAGKSGKSVTIIHTRESSKIKQLEKISKKKFERKPVPNGPEICKKQLFNLVSNMEKVKTADNEIEQFLPELYSKLEWLSKEDLIKKFVSVEFNRFLEYYKNAPDLNVEADRSDRSRNDRGEQGRQGRQQKSGRASASSQRFSRFHVTLGSKQGLTPPKLIGLLLDNTNNRKLDIGKIDIMKGFSFFEVEQDFEELVLKSFSKNIKYNGSSVKVEKSKEKPQFERRQGGYEFAPGNRKRKPGSGRDSGRDSGPSSRKKGQGRRNY